MNLRSKKNATWTVLGRAKQDTKSFDNGCSLDGSLLPISPGLCYYYRTGEFGCGGSPIGPC